ncbi:MAG: PH (Pleckstrin Homology) domain-containing protein [uncultured Aureispira sp.]|uniref:PH (Pleckstrin Homology) domain-containing protein n=1 Tax=uncultured Aureispira sp. TaxID=1331704 RepID=A0A6S6SRI9_9BACT|nr:MAG: PH (Pleckstrin Homology) domain-containing protein [uncultured Aureispira sp.]
MKNDILDDFSTFRNPLKQELHKHLTKKEQILWAERPKQGILFRASDGCMIPFSLAWGGFAIFWETMVLIMDAPIFMALFGIPFVLIGLYLIIGRFFHDMYIRRQTVYGLTDQRIVIKRGDKLRFVDLSALTDIQLIKKKNGSGSILFNDTYRSDHNKSASKKNNKSTPSKLSLTHLEMTLSFEAIPNVEAVYHQIEALRNLSPQSLS